MPRYTIRMNVVMAGLKTIVVDLPDDFAVGQNVSISPTANMTITNPSGGSVSLTPGVTVSGTIVSKD